jgi:hypothetical protein
MNGRLRFAGGRADPFGLLVLAVILALTVTIGIQAQASVVDGASMWSLFPKVVQRHAPGPAATKPGYR